MSILALDLTNIDDDKLGAEVMRRIKGDEATLGALGLVGILPDVPGDDLIKEVNKRLDDGTIEPDDIEIDPEPGGGTDDDQDGDIDHSSLDEAAVRFARRDYSETLWCLEKALGPAFAGLGDLKVGKP